MRFWRSVLRNQRIRVAVYVLVIVGLFLVRGPQWWKSALHGLDAPASGSNVLELAGADLAPTLVGALLESYRRDYPQARVEIRGGGTAHALQSLFDGQATVALLARPPLAAEQAHFETADGAPLLFEPIALVGIALLVADRAPIDSLHVDTLRELLLASGTTSGPALPFERVYAEDPNLGLWEALLESVDLPLDTVADPARVILVRDRAALELALRDDPRGIGVISSLFLAHDRAPAGSRALRVGSTSHAATLPTHENVGHGRYPLRHSLFVACRADARGEPAKFVTFASGARGQRIVERAGFLPARQFLREILLDARPVGAR